MLWEHLESDARKGGLVKIHSGSKELGDSELFCEEAPGHIERPPLWEGAEKIKISLRSMSKKELVERMIYFYHAFGTIGEMPNEGQRAALDTLLGKVAGWIIERKLSPFTFEHLKSGTKLVALKFHDVPLGKQSVVVKAANPRIDFERRILPGYKLCKHHLGRHGTPTTIIPELRLKVLATDRVPRPVILRDVIVQERCLVADDIMASIEKLVQRQQEIIRSEKGVSAFRKVQAASSGKITKRSEVELNRMNLEYKKWEKEVREELGLYDKDTKIQMKRGKLFPHRNYGFYCIDSSFVYRDWAGVDYFASDGKRTMASFDFDDFFRTDEAIAENKRSGKQFKRNRIPDVFEQEIREARIELLDRVLVVG